MPVFQGDLPYALALALIILLSLAGMGWLMWAAP
jgi:hypothetical protein